MRVALRLIAALLGLIAFLYLVTGLFDIVHRGTGSALAATVVTAALAAVAFVATVMAVDRRIER